MLGETRKIMDQEEQKILKYVNKYLQKGVIVYAQSAKGLGYKVKLKKNKQRIFLTFYLSGTTCICVIECPDIRMHVSKTMYVDMADYKEERTWLKVIPN